MIEETPEIDTDHYGRQLAVFGAETMGRLIKMRVLIQGLNGIGIETAKNMVLAGPKRVTVHDSTLVTGPDLGTNFFLRDSHIGKVSRADACISSLQTLNHYVSVDSTSATIDETLLADYDLVVFTECHDRDLLVRLNHYCRAQEKPKGFIWTGGLGLFGYIFVDYGPNHTIFDANGNPLKTRVIESVTQAEKAIVRVIEDTRHGFDDGDWVEFTEVQGMSELNAEKFKIETKTPFEIYIGDTTKFGKYTKSGYVTQVKVPIQKSWKSLEDALKDPYGPGNKEMIDPDLDFMRFYKPLELHLYLNSMLDFVAQQGRLPAILNDSDAATYLNLVKARFDDYSKAEPSNSRAPRIDAIDENLIKNISQFAETQIPSNTGFYGG